MFLLQPLWPEDMQPFSVSFCELKSLLCFWAVGLSHSFKPACTVSIRVLSINSSWLVCSAFPPLFFFFSFSLKQAAPLLLRLSLGWLIDTDYMWRHRGHNLPITSIKAFSSHTSRHNTLHCTPLSLPSQAAVKVSSGYFCLRWLEILSGPSSLSCLSSVTWSIEGNSLVTKCDELRRCNRHDARHSHTGQNVHPCCCLSEELFALSWSWLPGYNGSDMDYGIVFVFNHDRFLCQFPNSVFLILF